MMFWKLKEEHKTVLFGTLASLSVILELVQRGRSLIAKPQGRVIDLNVFQRRLF